MKTYYSLRCSTPQQSLTRSLAEPVFVLYCIGALSAILCLNGLTTRVSLPDDQQKLALVLNLNR